DSAPPETDDEVDRKAAAAERSRPRFLPDDSTHGPSRMHPPDASDGAPAASDARPRTREAKTDDVRHAAAARSGSRMLHPGRWLGVRSCDEIDAGSFGEEVGPDARDAGEVALVEL